MGEERRTKSERKKNQKWRRKDGRNPHPSLTARAGRMGHPKPQTFGKGCATRRVKITSYNQHRSAPFSEPWSSISGQVYSA
jgi:hypothetical protein